MRKTAPPARPAATAPSADGTATKPPMAEALHGADEAGPEAHDGAAQQPAQGGPQVARVGDAAEDLDAGQRAPDGEGAEDDDEQQRGPSSPGARSITSWYVFVRVKR